MASEAVDMNVGLGQVVSWYICTVVACIFLGARLFVKWKKFGAWNVDDAFLVLAASCLIGDLAIQHYMWNEGMARPQTASQENFTHIMQMIIPGSTLYVTSIWAIKVALVLFYKRIAARTKLQTVYNCMLGFLAVSWLVIFFDIVFQCYPIERKWSNVPSDQCSQKASDINYWITILCNILSDIIIISLPISMVMKLKMPFKQKMGVAAMFALGFFVVISSIIRAYYSKKNETMLTCTVSMVETAISIIAASLPVFRALLSGGINTRTGASAYNKSYELSSSAKISSRPRSTNMGTLRNMNKASESEDELFNNDKVEGGHPLRGLDSIAVTKEFRVSESTMPPPGRATRKNDF